MTSVGKARLWSYLIAELGQHLLPAGPQLVLPLRVRPTPSR